MEEQKKVFLETEYLRFYNSPVFVIVIIYIDLAAYILLLL